MKQIIVAMYDSVTGTYHHPFHVANDDEAKRSLSVVVNDPKTLIGQYPTDYSLYELGEFDNSTGIIVPTNPPRLVVKAVQLKVIVQE